MIAQAVQKALQGYATKERAKTNAWFFKTGKGEYGEGDEFIGVTVPEQRLVAKHFVDIPYAELRKLLSSKKHEHRLTALLILVQKYARAEEKEQKELFRFYLSEIEYVNNWDLVDLSAPQIVGNHMCTYGGVQKLYKLARSKNLWRRRIAIVATFSFIRKGDFSPTLELSEMLLRDDEALLHKAVGWMLREVGKRNMPILKSFLTEHSAHMPRTMLRYAIERFPETERKKWLKKDK